MHIPFCERKCAYCDFVSFVREDPVKEAYFTQLMRQMEQKSESRGTIPVDSVFLGGGTPSAVDPMLIAKTMDRMRELYPVRENAEITIEMNPNSVTEENLRIYKEAGINRVSLGLQSTDNEELKRLSRLHTYEGFLKAYDLVQKVSFSGVNIDIMSALPGQSRESYERTLRRVTGLGPDHISAYSLIIEEGTPFYDRYKDGKGLPDEDTEREMYYDTKRILKEAGYERYEISNYAKEGFECRHNVGYWTRKPYLGFGLAAASLENETRFLMHSDLKRYLAGDFSAEEEKLTENDIISEYMFLGLRLVKGISKADFHKEFGREVDEVYGEQIRKLVGEGLMGSTDRLFLTDRGMDLANTCMAEFIL